jgi:hypothetical protein
MKYILNKSPMYNHKYCFTGPYMVNAELSKITVTLSKFGSLNSVDHKIFNSIDI